MDDTTQAEFRSFGEQADGLMEEIEAVLEDEHAPFSKLLQTRINVDELGRRYRERLTTLSPDDRALVERTTGRKIVDIGKMATRLPAPPPGKTVAPKRPDEFFATREGKSSRQPIQLGRVDGAPRRGEEHRLRVTGEVESWCGPCNRTTTHVIAAMVGDDPAQVVCQVCNQRHKYRAGPPPRKQTPTKVAEPARMTAADQEQARKAREKREFLEALQAAEKVREFSPRERYKAGEILSHPEHGRGKIENVLPRSLLVRFAAGLKTLKIT